MLDNPLMWYVCAIFLTITFSTCIPLSSVLHIPASIIVLLVAFDSVHVMFYIASVLLTLTLSKIIKKHRGHILMALNIVIVLLFKEFFSNKPMDISGPLMLLVQKSYYLGQCEFTFLEKLKFYFFAPGILAGPVVPPGVKQKKANIPKALQTLYQALPFGIVYVCLENSKLKNIANVNWFLRIPCLYAYVFVRRCMYYFIWTLMHSCFLMQGFDAQNIIPYKVETATTLKEISDSWNIYTNMWLKESVFMPLKKYGFMTASLATFGVSAIWHGLNACYFVMFFGMYLASLFSMSMNKVLNGTYGRCAKGLFLGLLVVFFNYAFLVLNIKEVIKVWESVWLYGFIQLAILGLVFFYAKLFVSSKK